ncbi:MAG: hypothetical protein WAV95_08020 [Azonexus sp.]
MDIQSITSSVGAYTATPLATQSQSLQQAQQGAQVKPAEQREPLATQSKEEAPRPVTNTLGQETGKLINVTA